MNSEVIKTTVTSNSVKFSKDYRAVLLNSYNPKGTGGLFKGERVKYLSVTESINST